MNATSIKTRIAAAAAAAIISLSLLVATLAPALLAEPAAAPSTLAVAHAGAAA